MTTVRKGEICSNRTVALTTSTRLLATANWSRVSIPVTKILSRAGDVVDHSTISNGKIFPLSHTVCAYIGGPKSFWNDGAQLLGVWLTRRKCHYSTCVFVSNLVVLCQTGRAYVSTRKKRSIASRLSRSLKTIGTDDIFGLVDHSNHSSLDKRRFRSKIQNISQPCVFYRPHWRIPFEFYIS